jgi:hypothetical protein
MVPLGQQVRPGPPVRQDQRGPEATVTQALLVQPEGMAQLAILGQPDPLGLRQQ